MAESDFTAGTNAKSLSTDQIEAVARDVDSVRSLVQNLCRFAYRAENTEDFEAFHGLMWDLLPQIGLRLDRAIADLGHGHTGNFADGTLTGMFQGE